MPKLVVLNKFRHCLD